MTKLQQIAEAIYAAHGGHQWGAAQNAARAALLAAREPTEEMCEAGEIPDWNVDGYKGPKEVWTSMIDTILNEKPE